MDNNNFNNNNNNQYNNNNQFHQQQYDPNQYNNQHFEPHLNQYNKNIENKIKTATNFMGGTFTGVQKGILTGKVIYDIIMAVLISILVDLVVVSQSDSTGLGFLCALVTFVFLMLKLYTRRGKEARELDVQLSTIEAAKSLKNIEIMLQEKR